MTIASVLGYVDIMGISFATNTVTVNSQTAYRKGEYFRKELAVTNSSAPLWTNIIVAATGQTSVTGNLFVGKSPETFTYDADGNMTNDGRWALSWDAENRLTQAESLSSGPTVSKRKVVWEFDAKGRRIRQTTSDGSSGSYVATEDLKFLSDGWRHIAELNATNNALLRSYVWGLDLSETMDGAGGVGGLLMFNSVANGTHFYAYDGNGNVVALVKGSDGTVSANYEYDPFGQVLRATGPMANENRFQFSTKRNDRTTDFKLYEHRVLQSGLCWLSKDPLNERGFEILRRGTANRFNLVLRDSGDVYAFLRNDPLNDIDLFGLCAPDCNKCGENVTLQVFQTLQDIADTYDKAPWYKKRWALIKMFGLGSIHSWDIKWLKQYNSLRWAGCDITSPYIGCRETVTFEGKCVSIHELNYMMFGWAALYTGQHVRWEIYKLYLGLYYRLYDVEGNTDTLDVIARKIGFAEYGAQLYPTSPQWLAWPHWCETTNGLPTMRIDVQDWRWEGLKE